MKITMFGIEKEMYDFEAKSAIRHLDELKEAIKKPQYSGNGGYHVLYISGYPEYDYDSTVSTDEILEFSLAKIGYNGAYNISAILNYSIEDTAETARINNGFTGIYNHAFTFGKELQAAIEAEATRAQEELASAIAEEERIEAEKKAQAEAEKAALLDGVKWETKEKVITDEGGKTKMYIHTLTINGAEFKITERNIFDFGRVLNAESGGMYSKAGGTWHIEQMEGKGWISKAEQRAAEIVHKYGKFAKSWIRM